ncbi:PKD domain-containing protein, partial [bacterium]|nr:PKD domain-containing protein [bacterium]
IVHQVSGIWVELSNSQVRIHNNSVEAPVKFLGLYALRIASEDPRRLNTPPVAVFEFSNEPFPGMVGKPFEEAQAETAPQEEEAEGEAGAEVETEGAEGEAAEEDTKLPEGVPEITPEGQRLGKVVERRVISGQEAPKEPPEPAANVAEGAAPAPPDDRDEEAALSADTPDVTVYFDASASHDPDGKVVQYDWDFDADGVFDFASHASPYAEHTFKHSGDYTVALKVSDNGRYTQSGYGTGLVKIRNARATPKPLAANIKAYPSSGPVPFTAQLASTVTGGTPPYVHQWTFSDGSASALANPYTTYAKAGEHTIKFTVTDISGEEKSGELTVEGFQAGHPAVPLPRMLMSISPTTERGQAPLTAKFDVLVERGTQPITYRVSFGDEGEGEDELITQERAFTHVYSNSGFYLVKVIATDAGLRTASTFATVHAMAPASPRDFTVSDEDAGADSFSFGHGMYIEADYTEASERTVRFYPEDTPKPVGELAFHWDFGDGTYSTESKPTHTFARDGIFEVRLSADDGLQRFRQRIWLPVSAEQPAVALQRPPYVEGPAPLRLSFDAIVTRGEEPLRYDWFIGDARRSDPSAFYAFQLPGEYEVRLDVYDKHDQPIHAPKIDVRVRPGPVEYRQPLLVIQPVSGSTRAVVLDYTAANPLPLSSPHAEGPVGLVALSASGQHAAIVGEEGVIVKRVSDSRPLLAFLPSGGEIAAVAALDIEAAYCTVEAAGGLKTYLIRPQQDPLLLGDGLLIDTSGDGGVALLKLKSLRKAGGDARPTGLAEFVLYSVDAAVGEVSEPQSLGKAYEARLTADGRAMFYISADHRLVRRELSSGEEEYLSGGGDRKSGLAVSDDGTAVAFVSLLGERRDIIYGRYALDGSFRLASVTDQTGFYSEHLRLSADGRYLLAYGSRKELAALLQEAQGGIAAEDEAAGMEDEATAGLEDEIADAGVSAEEQPEDEEFAPRTPRRRERFGIIRLDLAGSPDDWNISSVAAYFIAECEAHFDTAGPF